jgi:hypothetical protein
MVVSILIFGRIGSTETGVETATDASAAAATRGVAVQSHCSLFIVTIQRLPIYTDWSVTMETTRHFNEAPIVRRKIAILHSLYSK